MEEAPENGKESSRSAHANGMNEHLNLVKVKSKGLSHNRASRWPKGVRVS